MYRQRAVYWQNTKFAGTLRKFFKAQEKPSYATLEEWEVWRDESKKESPFTHWVTEEMFGHVQNIVYFPYDVYRAVMHWVAARYTRRWYLIDTRLPKTQYHETDERMLHGMFSLLVDYIEKDKASIYGKSVLEQMQWEMDLRYDESSGVFPGDPHYGAPSNQAVSAIEQYRLYTWWVFVRPARKDRFGEFSKYTYDTMSKDDRQEYFEALNKFDQDNLEEDEQMLLRLVKIRRSLYC